MSKWLRGVVALALGFGLTLAAIEIHEASVLESDRRGTFLGPIELESYCDAEYGDTTRLIHPFPGAYGWMCWSMAQQIVRTHNIEMDDVCERTYGDPAYAEVTDVDDPYGWICRRGPPPKG